jgi:signal transduction histidine kinase
MSTNKPAKSTQSHEAWNLASALRDCFVCGTIHVEGEKVGLITSEAAQILGLSGNQVLEPSLEMFPQGLREIIQEVRHSGEPVAKRQLDVTIAGRRHFHLCVSALPLRRDAKHTSLIVTVNDLTSAKRLSQTLGRLDRLANLGTLSASMAHEIKNGMVAIKTFTELLLEKSPDAELNEVVGRELQRINGITTQMLRFAAPKAATFSVVRAHDLLDHSLRLLQHEIAGKLISLQRNYRAAPDTVRGDDAQLQQAFMNLLLNSLEAMGANGVLTVNTEVTVDKRGARQLKIHVQDTGTGIARENLGRVFEPFFTTKKNGTGLGLAICRRIALEHSGGIEVRSEMHKGSRFTLTLPVLGI